ncbi:DotD/TraH family lipoprotein [Acetobacter papayae]|uniref:DotD/TraH family lipoprotein n=1 Tax=Acetobacter papayae TaxID=1076592 RepID=UPI000471D29A|nr:DotD/TraH family lipoprotein [Acetobacter papayae]
MLLAPIALAACHHPPPPQIPFGQQMAILDAQANALAATRYPVRRPGSVLPAELERPVSWHWSGTLRDGLGEIASQIGYHLIMDDTGPGPVVAIRETTATEASLIDELSLAAGPRYRVDIDVPTHEIRVSHHG